MERIAGYSAIASLCEAPFIAYRQERYVTCLDMGTEAIYAEGWNRQVKKLKMEAKKIKHYINCERIYPPLTGNPEDLYKAANPGIKPIPGPFLKSCVNDSC